jgi:hypothetical protein
MIFARTENKIYTHQKKRKIQFFLDILTRNVLVYGVICGIIA